MSNLRYPEREGEEPTLPCPKCNDTSWYHYDSNHAKKCEACCKHGQGWWLLKDHYGADNGKWCCRAGCGHTVTDKPKEK